MGIEQSAFKGHRSKYGSILSEEIVDYKNPKFVKRAKNELYELFQADKIVHREVLMEIEKDINKLTGELNVLSEENKLLKEKIRKYENERVARISASQNSHVIPADQTKQNSKKDKDGETTTDEETESDHEKEKLRSRLKDLAKKMKKMKKGDRRLDKEKRNRSTIKPDENNNGEDKY